MTSTTECERHRKRFLIPRVSSRQIITLSFSSSSSSSYYLLTHRCHTVFQTAYTSVPPSTRAKFHFRFGITRGIGLAILLYTCGCVCIHTQYTHNNNNIIRTAKGMLRSCFYEQYSACAPSPPHISYTRLQLQSSRPLPPPPPPRLLHSTVDSTQQQQRRVPFSYLRDPTAACDVEGCN